MPIRYRPGSKAVLWSSRLMLKRYFSSAWLVSPHELNADGSWIVISTHQSMLDVPLAILASAASNRVFATWAHPDILRTVPFLRRLGFLDVPDDPQGFGQLISGSRRLLRSSGNRALWIFPQGRFFHRNAEVVALPGVDLLIRACPDIQVVVAGIDYSAFRSGRPHGVVELTAVEGNVGGVSMQLARATRRVADDAAIALPSLVPPIFRRRTLAAARPDGGPHAR